jgi:hypothetical protein
LPRLSKVTTSPLTVPSGVLLLIKEEKDKILNIKDFPSFFKEGCHDLPVVTGW